MKLITEEISDVRFFSEEKGKTGGVFIEGTFLQGDIKNRNGRIYPFPVLAAEVRRYTEDFVKKGRAFGELGHPEGPIINLERVSHMITELNQNGKNFTGRAKVLDTPFGKIVKSLIKEGAQLGVSSRGMGSLSPHRNGGHVVADDFHLATAADIVADPSAPEAFVQGIMEGAEWVYENGLWKAREIEQYKEEIRRASRKQLESKMLECWESLLGELL